MDKLLISTLAVAVIYLYLEQRAENQRLWMKINALKRELHPIEEVDLGE